MNTFQSKTAAACLLSLIAGPALAQDVLPGCYQRVYTAQHLANHPEQVVSAVTLWVGDWYTEVARSAQIEVIPADQGHAAGAGFQGQVLQQMLFCGNEAGEARCAVECDGGGFDVIRQDASGMTFRTDYMLVGTGGACGGVMDMAERPNEGVSYRLPRVDEAVCADLRSN